MLDSETKRRIDTARDILVGKVPDPKSQVEQITIALIYKFMDDMDAESEELGGERKFFAGEFAEYGWAKLMRSELGGHKMLELYAEAITRMPENPGIPPLFRDIFKNAYLPYRDPETLRSFLKIIDDFNYDHSERLGDAFEYLLSVLGSQGDAGQFRTPRHIIDFMVSIVDPKKDETVLDPACGTAGFLISSYKHILAANRDADGNSALTPDERGRLAGNFKGYDISPDMVRLSLANMYLHGFTDPHISEYDTLTSQDRWNEYADVILANPPFMSPKGGIKPHNRFSVQSKRSEVLFVDYMAEHLTPSGRAGIVVPEGVVFQAQSAYVRLRKILVEQYLVAVISLPGGVFNPYSGVKTSVLIFDRSLAQRADTVGFFKVENDGFDLGAQRRPIKENDLPKVFAELGGYLRRLRSGDPTSDFTPDLGCIVTREKVLSNEGHLLGGERYREMVASSTVFDLAPLRRYMRAGVKSVDPRKTPDQLYDLWSIPAHDTGRPEVVLGRNVGSSKKVVVAGDVLLSRIIPHIRRARVVGPGSEGRQQIASTEWIVFNSDAVVPEYLRSLLLSDFFHARFMQTITGVGGSLSRANPQAVGNIQIPVPPLDVQAKIVAEVEGYRSVINGARAVCDNYRPHVPIDSAWPRTPLGQVCTRVQYGLSVPLNTGGLGYRTLRMGDVIDGRCIDNGSMKYADVPEAVFEKYRLDKGDILFNRTNSYEHVGRTGIFDLDGEYCFASYLIRLAVDSDKADSVFVNALMNSDGFQQGIKRYASRAIGQSNINAKNLVAYPIPLPLLAVQRAISADVVAEQSVVRGNYELIARMERRVETVLSRVWGGGEAGPADV